MDTPISRIEAHPYGRRRVGTKVLMGAKVLIVVGRCAFVFITGQKYKLN